MLHVSFQLLYYQYSVTVSNYAPEQKPEVAEEKEKSERRRRGRRRRRKRESLLNE